MNTRGHHSYESAISKGLPEAGRNPLTSGERLVQLRKVLASRNLDAFVIPTADAHSSEYPPARFERRAFLTSFTGSAGTAIVTAHRALLWTDGRYFIEAEKSLSSEWTLMKQGERGVPLPREWLAETLPQASRVAIDPFVHTVSSIRNLSKSLLEVGVELVRIEGDNPVDIVWGAHRPKLPPTFVRKHPVRLAGLSVAEKLRLVRTKIRNRGATHALASMLDEVCWMYNIRGGDVPHCPVVTSYALIGHRDSTLYIDLEKVPEAVCDALEESGVTLAQYENITDDLRQIAQAGRKNSTALVWMNPSSTSLAIAEAVGSSALLEETPFAILKSRKNNQEIAAIKSAHIKDGTAKCQFLRWLEDYICDGSTLSEYKAGEKLEEFRSKQPGFITTSFSTIAGAGKNGAIIHYRAKKGECAQISRDEVFLLDSGGQYIDGTTDVTRTMHFGSPTEYEKICYTKVLQGHIGLDKIVFPEGTTGLMVDTVARAPLWELGLDFRHGTGHGVGASLNVHEGPQSISYRTSSHTTALQEGMVLSNEPGFYEEGKFGIRIENLCHVVEKETPYKFGTGKYLGFEKLTFVPIDKNLIALDLLSEDEIHWIETYHAEVYEKICPHLDNKRDLEWLREKTSPIHR